MDPDTPPTPRTSLTIAVACVAPVLYLVYVGVFAVNSFYDDDWSLVPVVRGALDHHLALSELWTQHFESRLLLGNVVDVFFGFADHFDLRAIILFNAVVFIGSYAILLTLVHRYLQGGLTPLPVLLVGATWFSLADVQNALWAFQVSWYLTVLFFTAMLAALALPRHNRRVWYLLALLAAVAASLSTVQGFLCWPVGAIYLVWAEARVRRELVVWCLSAFLTLGLYLPGYRFADTPCHPACDAATTLHRPLTAIGYFFALIGDVIPGGVEVRRLGHLGGTYRALELLGVVLFALAIAVVVDSVRRRRTSEPFPLPLLLVTFSLLFDVLIALGRGSGGQVALGNRYVMANLVLLTGVVIYVYEYADEVVSRRRRVSPLDSRPSRLAACAVFVSVLFLATQVVGATEYGIHAGRDTRSTRLQDAQLAVNWNRLPPTPVWVCEAFALFTLQPSYSSARRVDAAETQLGEFAPGIDREFKEMGPPALTAACTRRQDTVAPRATSRRRGSSSSARPPMAPRRVSGSN